MTLAVVIAVTVAVTLHFSGGSGGGQNPSAGSGGKTSSSTAAADVASANDTGPVGIITEDPSCAPWTPINNTVAGIENNGWDKRGPSVPASSWAPDVRAQYEAVGAAMRTSADQALPFMKMTPHRVMRELYGQYIAYSRAYADSIADYTPIDDQLARTASTAGITLTNIARPFPRVLRRPAHR